MSLYDVTGIGNAIVDVLCPCDEQFLIDYKIEESKVWFKFDDGREVSVFDYGNVELTKDSVENTLLAFSSVRSSSINPS